VVGQQTDRANARKASFHCPPPSCRPRWCRGSDQRTAHLTDHLHGTSSPTHGRGARASVQRWAHPKRPVFIVRKSCSDCMEVPIAVMHGRASSAVCGTSVSRLAPSQHVAAAWAAYPHGHQVPSCMGDLHKSLELGVASPRPGGSDPVRLGALRRLHERIAVAVISAGAWPTCRRGAGRLAAEGCHSDAGAAHSAVDHFMDLCRKPLCAEHLRLEESAHLRRRQRVM